MRAIFLETIFTSSVDFIGEVLATWLSHTAWEAAGVAEDATIDQVLAAIPEWLAPLIGVEDLPDAYRSVPLHDSETRAALVAVWCTDTLQWLFCASRAMLFGFSAAVIHFNRIPKNLGRGPDATATQHLMPRYIKERGELAVARHRALAQLVPRAPRPHPQMRA